MVDAHACMCHVLCIASVCCYCLHRPRSWIESQKMGAFMSVAKGSSEEPWLLELHYNCPSAGKEGESGEGKPTILVGKGANSLKFCGRTFLQSCADL